MKRYKGPVEKVCRPFPLGNPFSHKEKSIAKFKTDSVEESIEKYKQWIYSEIEKGNETLIDELCRLKILSEQGDLILGCWCVPFTDCHANIIKEILENM